jgi:hypothetical protein
MIDHSRISATKWLRNGGNSFSSTRQATTDTGASRRAIGGNSVNDPLAIVLPGNNALISFADTGLTSLLRKLG